jgi:hypothetical protein
VDKQEIHEELQQEIFQEKIILKLILKQYSVKVWNVFRPVALVNTAINI